MVTRFCDLSPDEQLAARAKMQATLDRVAASNDRLAERAAEREASGADRRERIEQYAQQREASERATAEAVAADARLQRDTRHIERVVDARVAAHVAAAVREVHRKRDAVQLKLMEFLGDEAKRWEAAVTGLEARIAGLEQRLAAAEKHREDPGKASPADRPWWLAPSVH
jgi:hypothetical protein